MLVKVGICMYRDLHVGNQMSDIELSIESLACLKNWLLVSRRKRAPVGGHSCKRTRCICPNFTTRLNVAILLSRCLNAGVSRISAMFG